MRVREGICLFLEGYFSTCDRSPNTASAYSCDLRQFRKYLGHESDLQGLKPERIEAWVRHLKSKGLAPASIKRKLAALRVFLNYWVRKDRLDCSPMKNLRFDLGKAQQLTKTLTFPEVKRLLQAARDEVAAQSGHPRGSMNSAFLAWRNLAILELMFATGMRVGEVASLHLSHLRLDERTVIVNGKGARERLADRRKEISTDSTALFISIFRKPLSTQGFAYVLKNLAKKAALEKHVTPHPSIFMARS